MKRLKMKEKFLTAVGQINGEEVLSKGYRLITTTHSDTAL